MAATALAAMVGRASAQTPLASGTPIGGRNQSIGLSSENVRAGSYLHDLAGPGAFASVIGGGVLEQIRGTKDGPRELTSKIGARAAQHVVDVSVRYGVAALMHRSADGHYEPCHCHGFGRKVGHALLESFTDRRDDGSRTLAIPRFAGSYAGGLTELAWNHNRNAGDVVLGTTLSFGLSALFNVAKELTGLAR